MCAHSPEIRFPALRQHLLAGLSALAVLFATSALSGCDDLSCGIGTHEEQGQCVPNVLTECGPGTRYVRGWCVLEDAGSSSDADEPVDAGAAD